MDIVTIISTAAQGLGIIKDLRELEKTLDDADFKLKLAEAATASYDAKMALLDAKMEIERLREDLNSIRKAAETKHALVRSGPYKYEAGPEGEPVGWPFCPVCLEDELKFYKLCYTGGKRDEGSCPKCKAIYYPVRNFKYPEV